jgi:hypothetical protein
MTAYERYLSGEMQDFDLPQDRIDAAIASLPTVSQPASQVYRQSSSFTVSQPALRSASQLTVSRPALRGRSVLRGRKRVGIDPFSSVEHQYSVQNCLRDRREDRAPRLGMGRGLRL